MRAEPRQRLHHWGERRLFVGHHVDPEVAGRG